MLVVKIELWPHGDESRARELGRMLISNRGDHPNRPKRGNYRVRLLRRGSKTAVTREATVEDYPRQSYPVWTLVKRALEALKT
jgi:hypothetical protein